MNHPVANGTKVKINIEEGHWIGVGTVLEHCKPEIGTTTYTYKIDLEEQYREAFAFHYSGGELWINDFEIEEILKA
jgi:hypothetical protein